MNIDDARRLLTAKEKEITRLRRELASSRIQVRELKHHVDDVFAAWVWRGDGDTLNTKNTETGDFPVITQKQTK